MDAIFRFAGGLRIRVGNGAELELPGAERLDLDGKLGGKPRGALVSATTATPNARRDLLELLAESGWLKLRQPGIVVASEIPEDPVPGKIQHASRVPAPVGHRLAPEPKRETFEVLRIRGESLVLRLGRGAEEIGSGAETLDDRPVVIGNGVDDCTHQLARILEVAR